MKKTINKLLKSQGWEIRRPQPRREDFLRSRNIDTVIDAGANIGQFARELRQRGFTGTIHSFEPVRESYNLLAKESAQDIGWKAHNCGLSNSEKDAQINVSHSSVFSSLHETTPSADHFDVDSATNHVENVKLRRLEDFDGEIAGSNLFLKVDTQGHERQVIEGAGSLLDRVCGIQLELPISALYKDTWTIGEAFAFMNDIGFLPTFFWPVNFHKSDSVAMVEVDCIFRRRDPDLD